VPSPARQIAPTALRRRGASRGFTLLEAIVAVAIVGIALIPVITFISQMVGAVARAGDSNARSLAKQSIIELLEPLNPLETPMGDDEVGELLIHWETTDIIPPNKDIRVGAGLAGFSLGFYNVTVSVARAKSGPWFSFDLRKVGYKRIGSFTLPGTVPTGPMPGAMQ
jgi:prepilin-type N-terminal cleavage/methylation domain-containing protein